MELTRAAYPTPGNQVLRWMRALVAGGYLARMSPLESKLAFAVTNWANYRTLVLFPSIERLAAAVGCKNHQRVRAALRGIEEMELMETTARGGGKGHATERRLLIPTVVGSADETGTLTAPLSDTKQGRCALPKGDAARRQTATLRATKQGRCASPQHVKKRVKERTTEHTHLLQAAERAFEAYPKKVKKVSALKAIGKALKTLARRGSPPPGFNSWEAWLIDRVTAYAAARRGQEQRYTASPVTWFDHGQYDDDPATWAPPGHQRKEHQHGTNGKNGANGDDFAIQSTRRPGITAHRLGAGTSPPG